MDRAEHTESPLSPIATPETVRSHVDRVTRSSAFRLSPRLQRLLAYLVEETLQGRGGRLKGYSIALAVFDRTEDFDPANSALVRVEVGRLRSKLLEYYTSDGVAENIRLELPKGSYAVRVVPGPAAAQSPRHTPPARAERPSIAVLPLLNLSPDAGQIWFSDGITEDLITDLSKVSGLHVCARHACFALRNVGIAEPVAAARKLGVRYVLHGSVRRDGVKVRISVHLVDAVTDSEVWAERYDRTAADVLDVQADVTQAIVGALAVQLSPLEEVRLGHSGTSSAAAHEEVLRGLGYYWRYLPTYNREAQLHFERATQIDPEYAEAHVWMARSTVYAYTMRWEGGNRNRLEEARAWVERALALDRWLPQAHALASWVYLWSHMPEPAVEEGARAVELDPNSADARLYHSIALSLTRLNGDGLAEAEMCLKLTPIPNAFYQWVYGMALLFDGQRPAAAEAMEQGVQLAPTFQPNHVFLMHTLVLDGRLAEAQQCAQRYELIFGSREVPLQSPSCSVGLRAAWVASLRQLGLNPQA